MNDTESRLTRLEEGQAFTDRAVEQLGEQVRELFDRLKSLQLRVAGVETTLKEAETPPASDHGAQDDPDDTGA